ncbi:probable receptor-like protein kinase At1g80640 [Cynara cardunculus var. scolymus]|uniref:probable receptor-like protein kinase At1g80640 n=1 Tax=Cynara cardunculus var. scolymus TaxID=59895 RepID=UPI000D625B11|nr:probable receptor-like protein kinase At1g80640 [Cynara cardunculus var. scolymus]
MKILVGFLFILSLNFQIIAIDARPNKLILVSAISVHESSPAVAPISPMANFSPGTHVDIPSHETHSNKKLVIGLIAASSLMGIILLPLICLWICRRKKMYKSTKINAKKLDSLRGFPLTSFIGITNSTLKPSSEKKSVAVMDYNLLEAATNNFKSEILGEGGFGCVYKAQLEDNLLVAVKRLDNQNISAIKEFQTEIDILSKIQHPNIISLLGYCVHDETKLLVYELMQNGSLETQLHGPSCGSNLTWHCRMKIALDTARGLEYLHEHCKPSVIHRDMKSSNILLDSNFNAKLSDFGLAVMNGANTKNIKLSGTMGYVAPEYLLEGKLTDKSDVYAFGVVLLELLLKRRPVEKLAPSECQSIVTWAMPQLTDRSKLPSVIDPVIRDTMDLKHLYQVAAVAVLCVQPEPGYRPLITDVLHSLVPLVPVELGGTLRVAENRVAATLEP